MSGRTESPIEFSARKGYTYARWADGFVVMLKGAEMAEDPTFRDDLIALAERTRSKWEEDRASA